jgi:IS5 family transposase
VLNPWIALGWQTVQLGMEMQSVIALRLMRLAGGGTSGRSEANRMIAEKIAAAGEAQMAAASAVMTGRSDNVVAGKVLRVLRKRVRANKRRLSPKGRRRRTRS